jgi:EmrB/QacA subfamily drug resistance transporter
MLRCMKQPTRSQIPWSVFVVTVAAGFMVALDLSIVNVAFPSIKQSFADVPTASLSWVLAGYSVVFGALLLGSGRIADRSGRRRIFLLGLLIFALGSLACGIAPSAWILIGGRVVQAVGAALLMPASLALLLTATPAPSRAQAVALWGGISALAVALGPSLGSVLIDAGGWRWAFFVNLPIAVAAGIATRRLVPESVIGGPVPDLLGVAILSGAVATLALAITQGGEWGWSSGRIVGLFVLAAVLGPLAIRRSAHHEAPAIDLAVFETRTVALANAATFLYAVGFFGMLLGNVLFLTSVWHYSTLAAGLAITPGPLVVAALSGPSGKLASRVGYGPVLVAGGLTFAAGLMYYVEVVGSHPHFVTNWLPGSLLVGLGVALTFPVLSAAAVAGLPQDRFGVGGAINQTARQIGAVLGVAILIAIIGTPTSVSDALTRFRTSWMVGVFCVLGSAAVSSFHRRSIVEEAPMVPDAIVFAPADVA